MTTEDGIIIRPIEKEMKESYIDYAMSVIVGRALPDVRDGLKPVHRRILYSMDQLSNYHNKPYKKCARIVGDTLGKYHPHGDQSVYNALVRMAQDFSMRYQLIDGQGNFGSIDGDSAAAMRYTESRMSRIAEEMLTDIDKKTVKMTENFDGTLKEPTVLPVTIPNLVVNGSTGIAVGMATNMLPHNLGETIEVLKMLIDNPQTTIEEIIAVMPGPDLPTGGILLGNYGVKSIFEKGRGSIIVRAKTEIVIKDKGSLIKIYEFPYMVNKANTIEKIAILIKNKKIEGIRDIKDLSDRKGILVEIDITRGYEPNVVLNNLFKHTDLEKHYGVINLALVNNVPRQLGIKQLLNKFIDFRKEIVTKRTQFDLDKAEERKHIVDGLIIAVNNIDKMIKTIKAADNPQHAAIELIKLFTVSDKQAKAILEMKLQKLTGLEREKLDKERNELEKLITWLRSILDNESILMKLIRDEFVEIKNKYGDDRRTTISNEVFGDIDDDSLVNDEPVVIILTDGGYIKRVSLEEYRSQARGGKGVIGLKANEDIVKDVIAARNRDWLLVFTDDGKVRWIKAYRIPQMGRYAQGRHIKNLLNTETTNVRAIIPVTKWEGYLITLTEKGFIKRTKLEEYSRPRSGGIIALKLREGDKVIDVKKTTGEDDIVMITRNGMAIRFDENDARKMSRVTQGVTGMRLKNDDKVIAACVARDQILTIIEEGYGKRTMISNYRTQKRGGYGVIDIKTDRGKVISAHNVTDDHEVILLSKKGMMVRMPVKDIRQVGRNTKGVRVMRLNEDDVIISSTIINDRIHQSAEEQTVENETIGSDETENTNNLEGFKPKD